MVVMDDCQRSHPRHDKPANKAWHCGVGRLSDDGDEEQGGDHPQHVVEDGYEWFPKEGGEETNIGGHN